MFIVFKACLLTSLGTGHLYPATAASKLESETTSELPLFFIFVYFLSFVPDFMWRRCDVEGRESSRRCRAGVELVEAEQTMNAVSARMAAIPKTCGRF